MRAACWCACKNTRAPKPGVSTSSLARREWLVGPQLFSVGLGQAEDLARVDQVRNADLIFVRAIDQGVFEAGTVVCTRNVPEIVPTYDDQAAAVARSRLDGDTVKRQFETGNWLAVLGELVEPELVLAGADGIGRREPPASVDARVALGEQLVVD